MAAVGKASVFSCEDDDDDLEALRLAALQTLRASKPNVASPASTFQPQRCFVEQNRGLFSHRGRRDLNHLKSTRGFNHKAHRINSNLITIVPTEDPNPLPTALEHPKLVRPQDRYCKLDEKIEEDDGKLDEVSSKFKRYEDSNSESSADESDEEQDKRIKDADSLKSPNEVEHDPDVLVMEDEEEEVSLDKLMDQMEMELSTPNFRIQTNKSSTSVNAPSSVVDNLANALEAKPVKVEDKTDIVGEKSENFSIVNVQQITEKEVPLTVKKCNNLQQSIKDISPSLDKQHSIENKSPPVHRKMKSRSRSWSPDETKSLVKRKSDRTPSPQRRSFYSPIRYRSRSKNRDSRSPTVLGPSRKVRSPSRLSISPNRLSRSPVRSLSPRGLHLRSPRRVSRSPRRFSRSPRRISVSPRRMLRSPRRTSRSPGKYSRSPKRNIRSPKLMSRSPRHSVSSPKRRSRSPRSLSRSPKHHSRSPKRYSRSPVRIPRSPKRVSRSPLRFSRSPKRISISPNCLSRSPRRRSISVSMSPRFPRGLHHSRSPRRSRSLRRSRSPVCRSRKPSRSPRRSRSRRLSRSPRYSRSRNRNISSPVFPHRRYSRSRSPYQLARSPNRKYSRSPLEKYPLSHKLSPSPRSKLSKSPSPRRRPLSPRLDAVVLRSPLLSRNKVPPPARNLSPQRLRRQSLSPIPRNRSYAPVHHSPLRRSPVRQRSPSPIHRNKSPPRRFSPKFTGSCLTKKSRSKSKSPVSFIKKDTVMPSELSYNLPILNNTSQKYSVTGSSDKVSFEETSGRVQKRPETKNLATIKCHESPNNKPRNFRKNAPLGFKEVMTSSNDKVDDIEKLKAHENLDSTILKERDSVVDLPISRKSRESVKNSPEINKLLRNRSPSQSSNISLSPSPERISGDGSHRNKSPLRFQPSIKYRGHSKAGTTNNRKHHKSRTDDDKDKNKLLRKRERRREQHKLEGVAKKHSVDRTESNRKRKLSPAKERLGTNESILEARRKKFESSQPVEPSDKKIRLKLSNSVTNTSEVQNSHVSNTNDQDKEENIMDDIALLDLELEESTVDLWPSDDSDSDSEGRFKVINKEEKADKCVLGAIPFSKLSASSSKSPRDDAGKSSKVEIAKEKSSSTGKSRKIKQELTGDNMSETDEENVLSDQEDFCKKRRKDGEDVVVLKSRDCDLREEISRRRAERLTKVGSVHENLPTRILKSAFESVVKSRRIEDTEGEQKERDSRRNSENLKKDGQKSDGRRVMVLKRPSSVEVSVTVPKDHKKGKSSSQKLPIHMRLGLPTEDTDHDRSTSRRRNRKVKMKRSVVMATKRSDKV